MKKIMTIMTAIFLIAGSQSAIAIKLSLQLETQPKSSEAAAVTDAKRATGDINAGRHLTAIADAALECPHENKPKFQVKRIQILHYLIPLGSDFEKKFAALIEYSLNCRIRQ